MAEPTKVPESSSPVFISTEDGGSILADTRPPEVPDATPPQAEAPDSPVLPSAYNDALEGPKPVTMVLNGYEYDCIPKLPARTFSLLVSTINGVALLRNMKKSDPATAAQVAVAFEKMVDMAGLIVTDEHWPHLDERLSSKKDPVDFSDLMTGIVKVLPRYTGASVPKA